MNNYLLDLAIEDEALGISYKKSTYDLQILKQLLAEINMQKNLNLKYLAQLDLLKIDNINHIIMKYLYDFKSSHIKAILLKQLFLGNDFEKVEIAIKLYNEFRNSIDYISEVNYSAPNHIVTIYDNLLSSLVTKADKEKIVTLFQSPRDMFYLPLTIKILSKSKNEVIKDLLTKCLNPSYITRKIGKEYDNECYDPSLSEIKYKLTLLCLDCLKYYRDEQVIILVQKFEIHKDQAIQKQAIKTLKHLKK